MATSFLQVTTTCDSQDRAEKLAEAVLSERLAACVQIFGPIPSRYWWQGKLETAQEWMCVMKTRADLYPQLEQAIRGAHTYEVPEVLATPVEHGHKPYLEWLQQELRPAD